MTNNKNHLLKIFSISLVTGFSRIFGLFREVTITALLGTTIYSDAFYLAYAVPNLFRRFTAEGAMLSAFIPKFTRFHKDNNELQIKEFVKNFFWSLFFILAIFCLFFILAAPWLISNFFAVGFKGLVLEQSIFLTRLMFIYILFISLTAFYQGILNFHSIFIPSAFSPVLLNIFIITCGIVLGRSIEKSALGLSIGVVLGGIAQFLFSHFFIWKLKYNIFEKFNLLDKEVKKTLILMVPGFFSAGIYQINILISYLISSSLYTGAVTSLTLSNRLIELFLGVIVISTTTVLLPQLSNLITKNKIKSANKKLREALLLTSFLALPASVGLIFTGRDIIQILFLRGEFNQNSVDLTFHALFFHAFGLLFIGWNRIFTSSMHSMEFFKLTAYLALLAMLTNAACAWYAASILGHSGIALANSLSQFILFLLNILFLPKLLKASFKIDFLLPFLKHLLASCFVVLAILLVNYLKIEQLYIRFFITILFSILTYSIACYFLKIKEMQDCYLLLFSKNKYKKL